jgi:hypothetical protein
LGLGASTKLFQSPHPVQRPDQLNDSWPQD